MGAGQQILTKLAGVIDDLEASDPQAISRLVTFACTSEQVFVMGAGRSGLVAQAFAMRLMHIGRPVHVAGAITTPRVNAGDGVIIVSASGRTPSTLAIAQRVQQSGASLLLVTASDQSPLRDLCQRIVLIPCNHYPEDCPLLPMGSIFELSTLIVLEAAIAAIKDALRISTDEMRTRHSILE